MPVTNYFWDMESDNVLLEKDETGATTAVYTNEPGLYGKLLSQYRDGETYFHHYDGGGDTRVVTDENENIVETATYSALGEVVNKTSSIVNPFGYKGALGYYTNAETNDIYVRARTYEPTIARWLSRDPLRFTDAPNEYTYVWNNPVNINDPSGMRPAYPVADMNICRSVLGLVRTLWNVTHPCAGALLSQFIDQPANPDPCPKECKAAFKNVPDWLPVEDCFDRFLEYAMPCNTTNDQLAIHLKGKNRFEGTVWPTGSPKNEDDLFAAIHGFQWEAKGTCKANCGPIRHAGCCCPCTTECFVAIDIRDTYDFCSSMPAGKTRYDPLWCACLFERWGYKPFPVNCTVNYRLNREYERCSQGPAAPLSINCS